MVDRPLAGDKARTRLAEKAGWSWARALAHKLALTLCGSCSPAFQRSATLAVVQNDGNSSRKNRQVRGGSV